MASEAVQLRVPDKSATLQGRLPMVRSRLAGRLKLGLSAKFTRFGLRRDLRVALEKPSAKIPILVRPLENRDLPSLFFDNIAEKDNAERLEVAWRRAFIDKGAPGGFVAIDRRSETPCYVQWLLSSRDNNFIQMLGGFPPLEADEALLENAYTPPAYRGLGIMSSAMALIAERAEEFAARYVLTFVDEQNIASLKGCQRAGFHPHIVHHRVRLCFGMITRDRFATLPDDDPMRTVKF
jgi:RimJ/RimL family protein N-acetyltransferase